MKNKSLLFKFSLIFFLVLFNKIEAQIVIPSSPESMTLVQSINTPAFMYGNDTEIVIPLHTISFFSLQVPITIRYIYTGMKVQNIPGMTGLGWQFSSGGKITRIMRQGPDETGFCNGDGTLAQQTGSWTASTIEQRVRNGFDGEPDIFYFEIGDRKGMFVFDSDGVAYTIPYQKVVIEWVNKSYFIITDEEGNRYTFGVNARETTNATVAGDTGNKTFEYTSSWYLEKMETPEGNPIEFHYLNGSDLQYTFFNERYTAQISGNNLVETGTVNQDMNITVKNPCYLSTITWRTGKVEFITTPLSQSTWGRKLDEIKIYSIDDEYLRSVCFEYSNFVSTDSYLKLDKIYESSYVDKRLVAEFEYNNSIALPARNTKDYDHWGYFNNAGNTSGRPTFTYNGITYTGANRNSNFEATLLGSLSRLYNAQGGYEEFEYELNDAGGVSVGGLRLKKQKVYPGGYINEYFYGFRSNLIQSSGVLRTTSQDYIYVKPGVSDGSCALYSRNLYEIVGILGSPVIYSSIVEKNPNGSIIEKTYQVINDNYANSTDYTTMSSITTHPVFCPNTSFLWKRILLKTYKTYDSNGHIDDNIYYSYIYDSAIKKTITGYLPLYIPYSTPSISSNLLSTYTWISQPLLVDTVIVSGRDIPQKTTITSYNYDYILPINVRVLTSAGDIYQKNIKYPFDYNVSAAPASAVNAYALRLMQQKNMIAYPIEVVDYKNGKVISGRINEYFTKALNNVTDAILQEKIRELRLTSSLSSYVPYSINSTTYQATYDNNYSVNIHYDNYDLYGNNIQFHEENKNNFSIVFGYKNTYPIAIIENASYVPQSGNERQNEVFYTSFEEHPEAIEMKAKTGRKALNMPYTIDLSNFKPGKYILTYWRSNNRSDWYPVKDSLTIIEESYSRSVGSNAWYIDEVSVIPVNAFMQTMSYWPGVGQIDESDYNGVSRYYYYDRFGRLIKELDGRRKVRKEYEYLIKQ